MIVGMDVGIVARWLDALIEVLLESEPGRWDPMLAQLVGGGSMEPARSRDFVLDYLRRMQALLLGRGRPDDDPEGASKELMILALGVLIERERAQLLAGLKAAIVAREAALGLCACELRGGSAIQCAAQHFRARGMETLKASAAGADAPCKCACHRKPKRGAA